MTQAEWALLSVAWWLWVAEILDYFGMTSEWLIVLSVMLVLDFLFWLLSAKARGEKIESRKRQIWLIKKLTRWLLPFIVAWWLKWTWMPVDELITVIVGMIIFSELYSIIWHIYSINFKESLPEADAFKMLLNWLAKLLKNLINKKDKELNGDDSDLDSKKE